MSYEFGAIVLARFPFTDPSSGKLRPALVISRHNRRRDIILAFITCDLSTVPEHGAVAIKPDARNGLKAPSVVRFGKLATLEASVVAGRLGDASQAFLEAARPAFRSAFGF